MPALSRGSAAPLPVVPRDRYVRPVAPRSRHQASMTRQPLPSTVSQVVRFLHSPLMRCCQLHRNSVGSSSGARQRTARMSPAFNAIVRYGTSCASALLIAAASFCGVTVARTAAAADQATNSARTAVEMGLMRESCPTVRLGSMSAVHQTLPFDRSDRAHCWRSGSGALCLHAHRISRVCAALMDGSTQPLLSIEVGVISN